MDMCAFDDTALTTLALAFLLLSHSYNPSYNRMHYYTYPIREEHPMPFARYSDCHFYEVYGRLVFFTT
jgi:hypothetical protein